MGRISRFVHLSAKDQRFLLKVACLIITIRIGLWLLSFQTLRQLLEQISKPVAAPPPSGQLVKMRIAWAVRVTSRYIPKATCLSQALATQLLLSRRGFSAELRIGVAKDETGQLKAHAWIESEGQIIIGGEESLLHYIPLPSPKENIDERYRRYLLQR